MAPACRDEHGPQIDVRVTEPVDEVALLGAAEDVVQKSLLGRVDQLPDETD
jgi:hypothetical protein